MARQSRIGLALDYSSSVLLYAPALYQRVPLYRVLQYETRGEREHLLIDPTRVWLRLRVRGTMWHV